MKRLIGLVIGFMLLCVLTVQAASIEPFAYKIENLKQSLVCGEVEDKTKNDVEQVNELSSNPKFIASTQTFILTEDGNASEGEVEAKTKNNVKQVNELNSNPEFIVSTQTFDLTEDGNASEGGIEGKSKEEVEAELNKKVAEGMVNISIKMSVTFEDGTSEGNLLIVNEDINTYPQVVEIYRDDNNELIYKSGSIPVGSEVETGKLSVDLDKGDYACTAYFNAVNPNTNELVGNAGAKITITVLN